MSRDAIFLLCMVVLLLAYGLGVTAMGWRTWHSWFVLAVMLVVGSLPYWYV